MTTSPEELELHRSRWRRAREAMLMLDPHSEAFATGGLGGYAPDVHVRFLVLPGDPEADVVRFDEDFWSWWMEDRPNAFEGAAVTEWGTDHVPHVDAAVRFNRWTNAPWAWDGYLATLRNGGLEFGLGRVGSTRWRRAPEEDELHVFLLTPIVGRIWVALGVYSAVLARFAVQGPWEITVALRDSHQAVLGNVAAEPESTFPREDLPRCPDPYVLIRREVFEWPNAEGQQSLAFELGGNVEDAFGFAGRRFLARVEPGAGSFDVSRYQSRG